MRRRSRRARCAAAILAPRRSRRLYSALNFWLGPLWGSSVHRRYGSNYSLWPEQAGPRRAIPLKLAALLLGSFSALAIYNVVTYFLRPVSIQEVAQENAVARVPINRTATTPVTAADPVEPGNQIRSRRSVAKSTLPTIGTRAITPSPETDGLGDTDSRGGDVLEGDTPRSCIDGTAYHSADHVDRRFQACRQTIKGRQRAEN